jgi:hypothetical protein
MWIWSGGISAFCLWIMGDGSGLVSVGLALSGAWMTVNASAAIRAKSAHPRQVFELEGQFHDDQLVQADSFRGSLPFQSGLQRTG